jgi:general stress protein YciG
MATDNKNKQSNQKSGGSMTTAEAGRLGGEKVLKERGPEFYSEIGSQQGKENNPGNFANRSPEEVRAAAEAGGRNSHKNRDSSRGDSDRNTM